MFRKTHSTSNLTDINTPQFLATSTPKDSYSTPSLLQPARGILPENLKKNFQSKMHCTEMGKAHTDKTLDSSPYLIDTTPAPTNVTDSSVEMLMDTTPAPKHVKDSSVAMDMIEQLRRKGRYLARRKRMLLSDPYVVDFHKRFRDATPPRDLGRAWMRSDTRK